MQYFAYLMQVILQGLLPMPLQEKLRQRESDIWHQTISFEQGEWVKIKAPSGTGKTTLVHILYKLRNDYEGDVLWNNKALKNIKDDELAKLRQQEVSVVFQDMRLFPQLSAKENIELNRVLQKPFYESDRIDEMAGQLGITHILHQKAGLCSYGEQQRITIIRALIQPFSWLLMDEPFSHLDHENTNKAATLIEEECKKRKAGFILTDLDEDVHFSYTHKLLL